MSMEYKQIQKRDWART